MDDDKLHKKIASGRKAQAMISGGPLEPVAFKDAVEMLKTELMKAWSGSKSTEDRERIWISVNLLERVADTLTLVASNGRVAEADLDRIISSKK